MIQLAPVSLACDGPFNVFFRSHSLAVGYAIMGWLPVLFFINGYMYMVGQKEEARDEEDEVQGIVEELV